MDYGKTPHDFADLHPNFLPTKIHSPAIVSAPVEQSYERKPTEWIGSEEALKVRKFYTQDFPPDTPKRFSEKDANKKVEKEAKRRSLRQKRDSVQEWLKSVEIAQFPSISGPRSSSHDGPGVTVTSRAFLSDSSGLIKNDGWREKRDGRERNEGDRTERASKPKPSFNDQSSNASKMSLFSQKPNSNTTARSHDATCQFTLPSSCITNSDFLSTVGSPITRVDDSKLLLNFSNSLVQESTDTSANAHIGSEKARNSAHHAFIRNSEETLNRFQGLGCFARGPDDSLKEEEEEQITSGESQIAVMDSSVPLLHHSQTHEQGALSQLPQKLDPRYVPDNHDATIVTESSLPPLPASSGLSILFEKLDVMRKREEEKHIRRSLAEEMRFAEQKQVENEYHTDEGVIVLAQDDQIYSDEDEDIDVVDVEEGIEEEAFEVVHVDDGGSVVTEEFQKTEYGRDGDGSVSSSVCIV
ncbi:hypothetical protein DFJ43DRAFT_1049751 [Lentinula guzmanii]|uniref:Uncharacterized protein n=1 Tax=Lentinula guzmanii TaxID=2804957 RepID=A0AA38JUW1_9AGAR|nr:hypothetical protein DFJ43DRAFT_1049751 [Lentinula guzmanii]